MGTNVNFYQELNYLTFILRILVFIFSTNKSKFLKEFYSMYLRKLPSQHGYVSVINWLLYCHVAWLFPQELDVINFK